MAKIFLLGIFGILIASVLSFPSVDDNEVSVNKQQALLVSDDGGKPEAIIVGEDLARAGISNLFNISAWLVNQPPTGAGLTFIPLITILSSIRPPATG